MRLGTAIERLFDNYVYASDKEWINDKVAWALYQTWKEADIRKANTPQTDCETCKHYKLACELFSEVCKYEPITQTETQNSNLTFEKQTDEEYINNLPWTEKDCPWK